MIERDELRERSVINSSKAILIDPQMKSVGHQYRQSARMRG